MINAEIRPLWQQSCLLYPEVPIRSENILAEVFVDVMDPAPVTGYAEELRSTASPTSPLPTSPAARDVGRLL